jgi:hypothetical protein
LAVMKLLLAQLSCRILPVFELVSGFVQDWFIWSQNKIGAGHMKQEKLNGSVYTAHTIILWMRYESEQNKKDNQ